MRDLGVRVHKVWGKEIKNMCLRLRDVVGVNMGLD